VPPQEYLLTDNMLRVNKQKTQPYLAVTIATMYV